jgi:hypothetical protein
MLEYPYSDHGDYITLKILIVGRMPLQQIPEWIRPVTL